MEDIVIESLKINGMDVFYLPRSNSQETDLLFGDDSLKEYRRAYPIEMYLENVSGMEGEGDFISKFGLEIRDEMSFLVSRRRFKFATQGSDLVRPREGDIVYVPLIENFFEITFVEHENDQAMFYTLGRGRGGNVYVYALKLKQLVFSNEVIQTGISQIDEQIRDSYSRTRIYLTSASGYFTEDETIYQGASLANATAQALVYSTNLNSVPGYVDVYRVQGKFSSGNLISTVSGVTAVANTASDTVLMDNAFEDIIDNERIQNEGLDIIDWTEKNPFGET